MTVYLRTVNAATAMKIARDAQERLRELADAHGCEASSAVAFEAGRIAALDELGLTYGVEVPATPPASHTFPPSTAMY